MTTTGNSFLFPLLSDMKKNPNGTCLACFERRYLVMLHLTDFLPPLLNAEREEREFNGGGFFSRYLPPNKCNIGNGNQVGIGMFLPSFSIFANVLLRAKKKENCGQMPPQ